MPYNSERRVVGWVVNGFTRVWGGRLVGRVSTGDEGRYKGLPLGPPMLLRSGLLRLAMVPPVGSLVFLAGRGKLAAGVWADWLIGLVYLRLLLRSGGRTGRRAGLESGSRIMEAGFLLFLIDRYLPGRPLGRRSGLSF